MTDLHLVVWVGASMVLPQAVPAEQTSDTQGRLEWRERNPMLSANLADRCRDVVGIIASDDEVIPLQSRIESVGEAADLKAVYDTEQLLVYVA